MSTTSSTTLDVMEAIIEGVGFYLGNAGIYLLIFAFLFGMFTSLIAIVASWRIR